MNKTLFDKNNLADLITGNISYKHQLAPSAPLFLKLNDNLHLLRKIQSEMKCDKIYKAAVTSLNKELLEFKEKKLWLKINNDIITMNLYDVYKGFLTHLRYHTYKDELFNFNNVSFLGPLGPFKSMTLISCLNSEICEKFIFQALITNKLPLRCLRIHASGGLRVHFGTKMAQEDVMNLKQITSSGLLFSTKSEDLISDMALGEYLKVFMSSKALKSFSNSESLPSDYEQFFNTKDTSFYIHQSAILKSLSYQSTETNEVFFFCRYKDIKDSDIPLVCYQLVKELKAKSASYAAA